MVKAESLGHGCSGDQTHRAHLPPGSREEICAPGGRVGVQGSCAPWGSCVVTT